MSDKQIDQPIALYPGQWVERSIANKTATEGIAKLACAVAGLDPTDEENEPITAEAWGTLLSNAREHLAKLKETAQAQGIKPIRVHVVPHPLMLYAAVFVKPSAVEIASMMTTNDETLSPADGQFTFSTLYWTQHALWPRVGTPAYETIFEGYPGAWHSLAGLARNSTGLGPALKKRA